jgi:hypothetical protein
MRIENNFSLSKLYEHINSEQFKISIEEMNNPFNKILVSTVKLLKDLRIMNENLLKWYCLIGMMPGGMVQCKHYNINDL